MKSPKKSKAFSLIELLISIIILGIIMVTIPIFLSTFTSSAKVTIKESVFFSEFSLISLINQKYFDENNTRDDNFYKDLNATGSEADDELKIVDNGGDLNRIGKHQINNNIFRSGSSDTLSVIGIDISEDINNVSTFDDIDDFNDYNETISVGVTSSGFVMKVKVGYIKDEANYNDENLTMDMNYTLLPDNAYTNIKLISITTTLNDGSIIKIEYPTCNIGASRLYSLEEIK